MGRRTSTCRSLAAGAGRVVNKTVPLTLPEKVWGRLASVAAQRNVDVADLIAEGVRSVLQTQKTAPTPEPAPPPVIVERPGLSELRRLVEAGLSDAEISAGTNMTRDQVGHKRRSIGLPPNKPSR